MQRRTQEHVGQSRHLRNDVQLLIDRGDSRRVQLPRAVGYDRLAADADLAAVGLVRTRQDADQCRFASAIGPDQAVHLAGCHIQADILQRTDPGKAFRHIAHGDRCVRHVIPTRVEFDAPAAPPRHAGEGRYPRISSEDRSRGWRAFAHHDSGGWCR